MKKINLLIVFALVFLASCELDPSHIVYSNAIGYITAYAVPSTGKVGEAVSIAAVGEAYNDCWKELKVTLDTSTDKKYVLMALGYYESYGTCNTASVKNDTIITFTPKTAGDYVIYIYKSQEELVKDTIVVTP
jgi:hypothetical protein